MSVFTEIYIFISRQYDVGISSVVCIFVLSILHNYLSFLHYIKWLLKITLVCWDRWMWEGDVWILFTTYDKFYSYKIFCVFKNVISNSIDNWYYNKIHYSRTSAESKRMNTEHPHHIVLSEEICIYSFQMYWQLWTQQVLFQLCSCNMLSYQLELLLINSTATEKDCSYFKDILKCL